MKIYNNTNINFKHKKGVVAIGNFDGVHLGHQKVLKEAKIMAKKLKLTQKQDLKCLLGLTL